MKNKMSFVITSCGREDLLDRTLKSFFKFNDFPIQKLFLTEDSVNEDVYKRIEKNGLIKLIFCLIKQKKVKYSQLLKLIN